MSDIENIKQQVDMICSLALGIPTEDAIALVNEIDRTVSLMPIVDPTGYKEIMFSADAHLAIARVFLAFRADLGRIIAADQARVMKRRIRQGTAVSVEVGE